MIRDISLCLNGSSDDAILSAAQFALQHKARLTGLYIMIDNVNRYYAYEGFSVELMEKLIAEEKNRADKATAIFSQIAEQVGCDFVAYSIREDEEPKDIMLYADLIFITGIESNEGTRFEGLGFINHLILETGRPVIIIPNGWKAGDFGQKILLGWNETRESARAMHATTALMQAADSVNIVTVNTKDNKSDLGKGINVTSYLTRHGVNAKFYLEKTNEELSDVGEVLLAHAHENNIDLAIVGGYSHSRIREIIMGGNTRYLIYNATIPLLLVH